MSSEEQAGQDLSATACWGDTLKMAREAREWPQSHVAAQLNLPVSYINTLENSSVVGLPSIVFARGYVRAYARLLKLDDNAVVGEFDQSFPGNSANQAGQIKSVSRIRQQAKVNDPLMKLVTWLFVLGILFLTYWWWQTQSGSTVADPATAEPAQVQPEDAPVVNEDGTLVLPKLDEMPEVVEPAVEENTPMAASEPEPVYLSEEELNALQDQLAQSPEAEPADVLSEQAPVDEPVATSEGAELGLSIEFVGDCWVSVRDAASNKSLVAEIRRKGQVLSLNPEAAVKITLGAANAVGLLTFNGEAIDLDQYNNNNVVRLTLPQVQ